MIRTVFFLSLVTSVLLAGSSASNDEQAIAKGAEVSAALLQKLGGEVKAHMQAEGPIGTLHFCSQNALVLTEETGKQTRTSVKRVSLKNRNPVNAPTQDEMAVLQGWEKLASSGQPLPAYEYKRVSETQSLYYKPILINNEACLKCHGDLPSNSELAKSIRSLYPDDKATGYKMGDLRGIIVVTIPQ